MQLSYSAIRTLLTNEYLFYQKYIQGKKIEYPFSPAMRVGNQVHNYIELLTQQQTVPDIDYDRLQDELLSLWITQNDNMQEIEKKEKDAKNYIEQIHNALHYFVEYYANNPYTPLATEKKYVANILGYDFVGYIDCIKDNGDGTYDIIDYKTVSNTTDPNTANVAYELQAGAYIALLSAQNMVVKNVVFLEISKKSIQYDQQKMLKKDMQDRLGKHQEIDKKRTKEQLLDEIAKQNLLTYNTTDYIQPIVYNNISELSARFHKIYQNCVAKISNPLAVYIPNPFLEYATEDTKQLKSDLYNEFIHS